MQFLLIVFFRSEGVEWKHCHRWALLLASAQGRPRWMIFKLCAVLISFITPITPYHTSLHIKCVSETMRLFLRKTTSCSRILAEEATAWHAHHHGRYHAKMEGSENRATFCFEISKVIKTKFIDSKLYFFFFTLPLFFSKNISLKET